LHGLRPDVVAGVHAALAEVRLSTLGAAGDTVRNPVVDPTGGLLAGTWDLLPLALAISAVVRELPEVWSLPRKFKLSFSGGADARMRPWASDVGFVAAENATLSAIVGGSLGPRPATGIQYPDALTADEALALSVAAVRLHDAEGDREHRSRARLRHVRERLGDAAFLARLDELFAAERAVLRLAVPRPLESPDTPVAHIRLSAPHGDVPIASLRALVDAVGSASGELRIGLEHDLHVFGVEDSALPAEVRAWVGSGRLVACPGTALCSKAAGPTYAAADALAPLAAARPELLFAVSGCPNSCAHAGIADVGIIASSRGVGGKRVARYRVLVGGDAGGGPALAEQVASDVSLEALADEVAKVLGDLDRAKALR
jgi:sulfite reductase beta subunit-like hemoprotein